MTIDENNLPEIRPALRSTYHDVSTKGARGDVRGERDRTDTADRVQISQEARIASMDLSKRKRELEFARRALRAETLRSTTKIGRFVSEAQGGTFDNTVTRQSVARSVVDSLF